MVGKHDETGARLISWIGELSPRGAGRRAGAAARSDVSGSAISRARVAALLPEPERTITVRGRDAHAAISARAARTTLRRKVPEGSKALAGIGCHFMASWMDRETSSLIQMGGEGVNWAASSRFTGNAHVFQNLGEGTYYHSGSMAIRQAIAAKANITYKILFNDAVAMTGGQPVDGPVSVHAIAHSVRAEGVSRIALVSDEPSHLSLADFPAGVTIHPREEMDDVQRELREVTGVSVLIYQQTCATEKRRRRKRGHDGRSRKRFAVHQRPRLRGLRRLLGGIQLPERRAEGDAVRPQAPDQPLDLQQGFFLPQRFLPELRHHRGRQAAGEDRKRDRSAGACRHAAAAGASDARLSPYDLLVTGVGGTGVITVGALIAMAGHLEGPRRLGARLHRLRAEVRPGAELPAVSQRAPDALHQVRIDQGAADALIGCDLVVSSSAKASGTYRRGMRAAVNTAEMPTGDVVRFRDADLASPVRLRAIERVIGPMATSARSTPMRSPSACSATASMPTS